MHPGTDSRVKRKMNRGAIPTSKTAGTAMRDVLLVTTAAALVTKKTAARAGDATSGMGTSGTGGTGAALTIANVSPVAGPDPETRQPNVSLKVLISTLLSKATDANHDNISFTGVNTSSSSQGATLFANSTYVFYLPTNNNSDTFTYNLSDGHGGTATGT